MRVCEKGLDVNDPCNAKWDTKGCYATMNISSNEMEREGFDYKNLVTGEVKIFDPNNSVPVITKPKSNPSSTTSSVTTSISSMENTVQTSTSTSTATSERPFITENEQSFDRYPSETESSPESAETSDASKQFIFKILLATFFLKFVVY